MAKLCIGENHLEEALDIYLHILHSNPDEPEVLKMIGELYFAAGNEQAAEKVFSAVLQKHPEDKSLLQKIKRAHSDSNRNTIQEPVPTSPEALRRLIQTLTHREQPISKEELSRASKLLDDIIHSSSPASVVAQHLDEVDNLLPALIDLNIQQAKSDGRSDLAAGLINLKTNITFQQSINENRIQALCLNDGNEDISRVEFSGKVAVYQPGNNYEDDNERIRLLSAALATNGCLIPDDEGSGTLPDIAVFSNPFLEPQLMEKMVKLSTAKIPIILDLNPIYEQTFSPAARQAESSIITHSYDRSYVSALILADLVTVNSEAFTESLRMSGNPAMHIPTGWTVKNPYWAINNKTGVTLQMGWFGNSGSLEDLAVIRRPLIRLLSEFNDKLRLIIVGDQDAYRMFDHVPAELKTFIPCLVREELPYIINQMDIILLPLRKTMKNTMRSDELLMYAGIKKIPWVASPFSMVKNWGKGGVMCTSLEEWHTSLRCLLLDKGLRESLGYEGFQKATRREMLVHVQQWFKAFRLVQAQKKK